VEDKTLRTREVKELRVFMLEDPPLATVNAHLSKYSRGSGMRPGCSRIVTGAWEAVEGRR